MKIVLALLILASCSSNEIRKTNYVLQEEDFAVYSGLIAPKASDYLKMETSKMIRSFAGENENFFAKLPASVDLSTGLPEAGNQGKENSCTGFALAFAVKSFQENRELGWGLADHLFSPSFIYNQLNGGKDEGIDLTEALDFIGREGVVPLNVMPYREGDFKSQPSEAARKLALDFRGLGYRRIDEKNISHIKAHLASGEPVLLVIEMHENFLKRGMQRSKGIYREKEGKTLGYHALAAVGYDQKGIKILNSWGKGWGENGFGWIAENFAPEVIKQAFIVYDTPTPQATVAALSSGNWEERALAKGEAPAKSVAQGSLSGLKSGAYELSDQLLIVPEEAGMTLGNQWLRLAQPLSEAGSFASLDFKNGDVRLEDDALKSGNINKILFYFSSTLPVSTNQGVTFGSARDDVHRIYGIPDFVDETGKETYFFHAIAENWGGVKITKHASLNFQFNTDGRVGFMSLENVFKNVVTGTALQKVEKAGEGISGDISFTPPPGFTDVNKSVWEGTGYGYFIKNSANISEYIAVKSFQTTEPVSDSLLKTRMEADAKTYPMTGSPASRSFAGLDWTCRDGGTTYFCYGGDESTLYQIQIASDKPIASLSWPEVFLQSIKIKK
ncbi:MAG: C1 family peptidase [Deltaproteobacteria bacterium]|nr:C1 family peptidase [Deltaproteobacteria bacterium]